MRAFFLIFLALAACSGTTTIDVDSSTSSGSSTGTGSGTGGGASAGGGTVGGNGGSTSTANGPLLLQAFGGPAGKVAAQVPLMEPGVGEQANCTSPIVAGACQLTSCMFGGIGSPGGGYGDYGPLSASVGATTVPIPYDGTGYPTVAFPGSVALGTGDTMTFRGGDGTTPQFTVAATIPGLGVITSPVPPAGASAATINTSQDLTVTWIPIAIGQIKFGLTGGNDEPGGVGVSITCTFAGASGSGVVSGALLSSLKTTSGSSPVYGILGSELDATTVVEGLTILTQSFQTSSTGGGGFDVTLE